MKRNATFKMAVAAGAVSLALSAGCNRTDSDATLDQDDQSITTTVTGCLQKGPGLNNFVLSDVGAERGTPPEQRSAYKLEGGNDLEQHVGSQVQVTGQIETSDNDAVTVARRPDEELELGDLPEFHVDTLQSLNQTCSGTYAPKPAPTTPQNR